MKRSWVLVLCLLAMTAFGRGDTRAEATQLLDRFVAGSVPLNQLVNRLDFLNEQGWATDELLRAMHQLSDARRRGQLIEAVGAIAPLGHEDAEKALVAALASDDRSLRVPVLRGLGRMRATRGQSLMISLLKDGSPGVRREAATALGQLKLRSTGGALMAAATAELELETRLAMVKAVGRSGDTTQVKALEALLSDESEGSRLAAANALCLLGSSKGADFAKKRLSAKDGGERLQGVLIFDGTPAKFSTTPLKSALSDVDASVRATAARVLAQGGDSTKIEWLVVEASKADLDHKGAYEEQLEHLHVSDETRKAIIAKTHPKAAQ